MGGKSKAPPPPDYGPIAAASEKSAKYAFDLGQDQLAWAKKQYGLDRELTDKVVNSAIGAQNANTSSAARDRSRYEAVYQPVENQLVRDAQSYASPERKDMEMGRAGALVAKQFQQQRQAAQQQLEGFGVDPSSTRFAALDIGYRAAGGAAEAAAMNQAGQSVDATGRALRSEAINVGKGYPGQIASQYGTSLAAGNSAVNSQLAATASGANTMGTGLQWQGAGNQALGVWGNTLHMGYQDQLAQFQANQSQSSGIGSALGLIGGMATSFMAEGGTVPDQASPSQGQAIDDVPARLTPGEFVVPKDVVAFKGEEFFQKLIEGARKAKPQGQAQPEMKQAIPANPTFQSRPAQALPV
jgi:hypothetical protein